MVDTIKEKISPSELLFVTKYGSSLYGTQVEGSDTDYKAIHIPDIESLVLRKSPETYDMSSNKGREKNAESDTDMMSYSIQQFFRLLQKGDTNMVNILFADTNPDAVVYLNPKYQDLWQTIDRSRLLSKRVEGMTGYVRSQVYKYSLKGLKYSILSDIIDELNRHDPKYLLEDALNPTALVGAARAKYGRTKVDDLLRIDTTLEPTGNVASYLNVLNKQLNFREIIQRHLVVLNNMKDKFGHRTVSASEQGFVDWKAVYHAFRVLDEVAQLHETGELVYPARNRDFLLEIRQEKHSMEYLAELLDDRLEEVTTMDSVLPDKLDTKYADRIVLELYGLA